jgi:hypothetical protein
MNQKLNLFITKRVLRNISNHRSDIWMITGGIITILDYVKSNKNNFEWF